MINEIVMPVKVGDLTFKNPFFVASGPTTKSVKQLAAIERAGWSAASIKLTIDPAPYVNRVPRYGVFADRGALCFTVEKRLKFDEGLKLIEDAKRELTDLLLMANITYAGDDGVPGWVNMAKKFEDTGADIIELNMCCPNMSYNLELTTGDESASSIKTGASLGQHGGAVAEIVREIKKAVKIPVFVKLTPEGGNIAKISKELYEAGADVVGGTANRMGIPVINLENPTKSIYHLSEEISMSCHAGPWLKPLAQRDAYEMRKVNGPGPVITAAGGVRDYVDAIELIMCGADLIGICAETLMSGYDFIRGLIADLKNWMDARGYASPREFRDLIVPEVRTAAEVTLYGGYAKIKNPELAAPCKSACPLHIPAQAYVRRVAEGDYDAAYDLIVNSAPLQTVCGLVCDRSCESNCARGVNDSPVHIREIKRFALERGAGSGRKPDISIKTKNNIKTAAIGSGPAGLSYAYYMAREGFSVTVYEREAKFGGMLSQCLPAFRIGGGVIDAEINLLKSIGVAFESDREFGTDITFDSLRADGYGPVFLATGAMAGRGTGLAGEDADGVYHTLDFLRKINSGEKIDPGKTVVVLGGGFSAVDSARAARRLGAENVFIAYRRTKDEMPASDEINEAEDEGIKIMYLVAPESLEIKDGKLAGIRMRSRVLGSADDSGRRSPENINCEAFFMPCDSLVLALGQTAEKIDGIEMKNGKIITDPLTMRTNLPGVYAGGDNVNVKSVVAAVAAGRRAASAAAAEFLKTDFTPEPLELTAVAAEDVLARSGYFPRRPRADTAVRCGAERVADFDGYARVLTEEEAVADAKRCLNCGCGEGCRKCLKICCDFAVVPDRTDRVRIDDKECVACGMCYNLCPNKNIEMVNLGERV